MIALIVPCYNEEKRLNLDTLVKHAEMGVEFFFVDDGSKDRTAELILSYAAKYPFIHLIRMKQNVGKAEAVRQGIVELQKTLSFGQEDWIGFWDADLATPLSEIPKMIHYAGFYKDPDAIWCSRVYRLGADIERSLMRHYFGRGFATLIGELLKVKSYDSQCGAKLFRPKTILKGFSESFISKWIFDVEIMLRLHEYTIIEYPVTEWKDVPGSKVKVYKEIFRVFFEVLRIRKKYLRPH